MCGPSSAAVASFPASQPQAFDHYDGDVPSSELSARLMKHQRGDPSCLEQGNNNSYHASALRIKGRENESSSSSPPASPRSACSTPGRTSDVMKPALRRCLPGRQFSSNDRQRFSQDSARTAQPFSGNPWVSSSSHGAGSAYSSSSTCSLVRAISCLGLEGPRTGSNTAAGAAAVAARTAGCSRGSISKAKKILAEAINSVPGAHGMASCATSAADTGVLSPLLTIIRNNGTVRAAGDAGSRHSSSKSVSRRSSFSEAMISSLYSTDGCSSSSSSSSTSSDSSEGGRVLRRSSVSEGAGSLNASTDCSSAAGSTDRTSSLCRSGHPSASPSVPLPLLSPAQQQQKVVDCLETVRYLAMDDSNRMALIDLGAVELLLAKLQPSGGKRVSGGSSNSCSSAPAAPAPQVAEAALSALAALAKHDATKLRVWDNLHSSQLLQLLAQRHTSPVVKAAHLCVANLAWSIDLDRNLHASCGSSVFDSVSSHPGGRDDASTTSSCGSNVLLTSALIPAIAAGLHPAADVPVLLSLLKLLNKAASSSCLAPSPASSPCGSGRASESSSEQLCTVQLVHSTAWKVGWQQAIFALPPLLLAPHSSSNCGRQDAVLGAVLEVVVTLTEQHPEFHAVVCAAGCLAPLLAVLLSSASSDRSLQAACALNALLDCPEAMQQLGQERSLKLLLQVLADNSNSVDVRLATLHMLRRLSAAAHCVDMLKLLGAVQTVVALLQHLHTSEVKRAAIALLQLLGKQVVVRPRKLSSAGDSSSHRSSFESSCSASSQHIGLQVDAAMDAAAQQLGQLGLQQQQHSYHHAGSFSQHSLASSQQAQHAHGPARTPCYLHAH